MRPVQCPPICFYYIFMGSHANAVSGHDFSHPSIQYPSIKRSVVRQGQAVEVKHHKKYRTGHFKGKFLKL